MNNKRLSIKHYAIGFIIAYTLIFLITGLFTLKDIHEANQQVINAEYTKSKNTLINALNKLIANNQKITNKFSQWDEVHQQLEHPEYYSYWLTHRLSSATFFPDYFIEAAIYNHSGKILDKTTSTTLPEQINPGKLQPYFSIKDNKAYLITTARIMDEINHKLSGFAVTKSYVLAPLLKLKQFSYIDTQSIKLKDIERNSIPANLFIDYLDFKVRPNQQITLFTNKLVQAMIRFIAVLASFALFFYFLLNRYLSRPLLQISAYIDRLNNNPELQYFPQHEKDFMIEELNKFQHSLSHYQQKLQSVYINLDKKNKELWQLAHHDALTGALNRLAFEERWSKIAEIFTESRCEVAIILFDVNNFKGINDTYGHQTGDQVLIRIARAIQQCLRKEEKLYRLGGDEFGVILYAGHSSDAVTVAHRCERAIAEISFNDLNIKEPVRASIGVACYHRKTTSSISDLLWQADIATYHAKKPGTENVAVYSEALHNQTEGIFSNKINEIVFDVIENGNGLCMHYQPIVTLDNETLSYYEALLRIHKNNELISPNEIFKLVEARKLEYDFDKAIIKQIARDIASGSVPEGSGISVNISGPSIIHHQIIEDMSIFQPFLADYKIVLEITETALITQIDRASEHIDKLKSMGFLIALDDFGSGYSSISYLSSMPVDIVKFDISLIRQLNDKKQYSIIRHLAIMIKETGHQLVAEGIETKKDCEKLKQLSFDFGQGYYFGKPEPLKRTRKK